MNKLMVLSAALVLSGCSNLVTERTVLLPRDTTLHLYDSDADGVSNFWDQCPSSPAHAAVTQRGCPGDQDGDGVPDYRDLCLHTHAGEITCIHGCTTVEVTDISFEVSAFGGDSAALTPAMKLELLQWAQTINAQPQHREFQITGHADSRGVREYNIDLSKRRAEAVAQFLQDNTRAVLLMQVRGDGERHANGDNGSKEDRPANRRVQIVGMHKTQTHNHGG